MTNDEKQDYICRECEKLLEELHKLCKDHELLLFTLSDVEDKDTKEFVSALFIKSFCPEGVDQKNPSEEAVVLMWESYKFALEAAIYIEKAKHGLYNPNP